MGDAIRTGYELLNICIMKKIALLFGILFTGIATQAEVLGSADNFRGSYDGNAFIFVEGTVEFSIFPDGQFDFVYVGPQKSNRITISTPNVNVSYNSGYNYDAYVQYDDYGAVIQVEDVPIYYDYYGRISRAGSVDIKYENRRLVWVGGLHIHYHPNGYYSHYTGFINAYNPYYVYRPWHVYYMRPMIQFVIVYDYPYRMHYHPTRYSYHQHVMYFRNRSTVAYVNGRRNFYRPGSRVHYEDGRVVRNNNFNPDRPNTMIASSGRNNSNNATTGRNETPASVQTATPATIRNTNATNSTTNGRVNTVTRNTNDTPIKDAAVTQNTVRSTGGVRNPNPSNTPVKNPNVRTQDVRTPVKAAPNNTRNISTQSDSRNVNTQPTTRSVSTPANTRSISTPSSTRNVNTQTNTRNTTLNKSSVPVRSSSTPTVRKTTTPTPARANTSRTATPARGRI